jgi:hypothetical protein
VLGGDAELIVVQFFVVISGRSTLDGRLFCEFRDDSGYYASKRGFELDFAAFGGSCRRVDIRTSGCGSSKSRDSYWKIICDEDCSMLTFNFPFLYYNNSVSFVVLLCTPKSKSGKLKLLLLNQNTPS